MDLFKRIQDLSAIYDDDGPSSTVPESRPMFANGQLVQPNADGSRLGYKGDKVYSDNYRTIYDKKTKLYSKKVGRDKKLLTQNPGETKKQFFNRVSNYSAEKSAERTSKFTKEIVDARSKIDSWTSNWLNNNLKNYGVKDFDKMTKDMKKDWRVQSKKLKLPTDKIQITTKTGFPNLSTSKGKESAVSKNPFSYDNVTFYTPENPSGMDKYKAQWKKIFYKNKIQTTPDLKNKVKDYFDFITLDKRGAPQNQTIKSFKEILDKDVLFLLSEKDSGLQKGSKFEVFNSIDELAEPYNEFTAKINRSETWKENANLIEKELGLKKNFIKNSMVKEQKAAAKFFGLDDLKGTGLEYSIDHGQGLSAAAKSGNKELMKTALNDLIGTTRLQNTAAGFGGFEAARGALIRDIEAGVNVKDNVASLNKLTKDAYKDLGVKSNIYSIKDGKLVSKPITTATTQPDRFKQYAETIYKDPLGKKAIDKKFGSLENVLNTIAKPDQIRLAKIGCPGKANGGRIGFNEGLNVAACAARGVEKLQGDPSKLTSGDQANVRALAKSGKAVKFLKGVLGPGAIIGEVIFEGGAAANKFMNQGMPIKQALGESYINKYLLGPKTQIDVEAERAKEFAKGEDFAMAERGRRMAPFMPQSATADAQRLKKREEEMKALYPQLDMANLPNKQIDKVLADKEIYSPFTLGFGMQQKQPGIGDMRYNEDLAYNEIRDIINKGVEEEMKKQQFQSIADAGGVANLAGGGIAKMAGDRSGAMTTSMNPDSQGLSYLMNRVKKVQE